MKNKKIIFVSVLLFIALIAGASYLYNTLSDSVEKQSIAINEAAVANKKTESQGETPENTSGTEEITENYETETANAYDEYKAPDFTVFDKDGNEVTLSDYLGQPVVLNFWASWCVPCQMEMPAFDDIYKEYGEDIIFLMVNRTDGSYETQETAQTFIDNTGYSFPIYFDSKQEAAIAYAVNSIPQTFFIDAKGNAVARVTGTLDMETLQTGIELISPKALAYSYLTGQ